jgi:hypothetical protein
MNEMKIKEINRCSARSECLNMIAIESGDIHPETPTVMINTSHKSNYFYCLSDNPPTYNMRDINEGNHVSRCANTSLAKRNTDIDKTCCTYASRIGECIGSNCFIKDVDFCNTLPDVRSITTIEHGALHENLSYHSVINYIDGSVLKTGCMSLENREVIHRQIVRGSILSRVLGYFR